MVTIDFLFFADCPSHDVALKRLQTILAEEQITADIRITEVTSDAQAQELKFVGSPTIRINSIDIDPPPIDDLYGLSCRAYHTADGRITPLPQPELIRTALRKLP
ncbi:MAG: DUF2703 domain-containing protein [Chloroflexi bacterium AL-W]|nr:DUF2703 domain-containing protein [Chloroflexi bacterium AL-N1]NOK66871.1 DUF2703 domain-containing protein [Chloroflexi bacterium AL-N10]NOK74837.1 DUF2703 domain-containing protein [Chloroflexi bacterium AL-N5]NOK81473.1 DUF2703 domain-containing protein [Chloroflexi bacterium AL-W]NOK88943.1 DUF2703 domain-containing protein [Chloroflexi bacterium AL-N15]